MLITHCHSESAAVLDENRLPTEGTVHAIRLRGAWSAVAVARSVLRADGSACFEHGSLPPPARMTIPGDWGPVLGDDFRGRVRFQRRFGRPSGLAAGDRVELVFDAVDARADVWLNDQLLGRVRHGQVGRFQVQTLLQPHNTLLVVVEKLVQTPVVSSPSRPDRPGGIPGEVRLVILPAA